MLPKTPGLDARPPPAWQTGWKKDAAPCDFAARREADLERLADAVEGALDWERLQGLLGPAP